MIVRAEGSTPLPRGDQLLVVKKAVACKKKLLAEWGLMGSRGPCGGKTADWFLASRWSGTPSPQGDALEEIPGENL